MIQPDELRREVLGQVYEIILALSTKEEADPDAGNEQDRLVVESGGGPPSDSIIQHELRQGVVQQITSEPPLIDGETVLGRPPQEGSNA